MRRAARRDANEPEIIAALLAAGYDVQQADFVDLIVGRNRQCWLLEVKTADGDLTPRQEKLLREWRGHYATRAYARGSLA